VSIISEEGSSSEHHEKEAQVRSLDEIRREYNTVLCKMHEVRNGHNRPVQPNRPGNEAHSLNDPATDRELQGLHDKLATLFTEYKAGGGDIAELPAECESTDVSSSSGG
jgi:hypothetical protein